MTSAWKIKESTKSRQYGQIDTPAKFHSLMRKVVGATAIVHLPQRGANEDSVGSVYHVEPQGVTVTYEYYNRQSSEIEFHGSPKTERKVQERLLKILEGR